MFGGGLAVAVAHESDDPAQKTIRKCRAAGDTVLVSKCRVMCLMRSGVERDLDAESTDMVSGRREHVRQTC